MKVFHIFPPLSIQDFLPAGSTTPLLALHSPPGISGFVLRWGRTWKAGRVPEHLERLSIVKKKKKCITLMQVVRRCHKLFRLSKPRGGEFKGKC